MSTKNIHKKLFSEFDAVSTENWEQQILADLKGQDYTKKLIWQTIDNIALKPYYRAEHLEGFDYQQFSDIVVSGRKNNLWHTGHEITEVNPELAADEALFFLNRGATAVDLNANQLTNIDKIAQILDKTGIDDIYFSFSKANCFRFLRGVINEYLVMKAYDSTKMSGCFNHDPLSTVLQLGYFSDGEEGLAKRLTELVDTTSTILPHFKALNLNGSVYHQAGANAVQELAFVFSSLVEYMNWFTDRGLNFNNIISCFQLNFSIGSSYFTEIAKLRAARLFWKRLLAYYNCNLNINPFISAQTSVWNMGVYDAYTNVLRATTETMSAVIAGADLLYIKPFDYNYRQSDDFSKRIGLNIQLLLKDETHLDKVIDPSAGSYFIENYTNSIFEQSWNLFTELENKGGFVECIKNDVIQNMIEETSKERQKLISSKKESILGVSIFPEVNEKMLNKIEERMFKKEEETEGLFKTLPLNRKAYPFEYLRLQAENFNAKGGKTPVVFMLPFGAAGMATARQIFSRNFFGVAGYSIIENIRFTDVKDGIELALAKSADVVVLCSSDDEYIQYAGQICSSLKAINKSIRIVVAGNPANADELKGQGVDDFIHIKSDLLTTLKHYHTLFNINIE